MLFDWRDAKARYNRAKHGVAFEAVTRFDFETALILFDDRRDYGEIREQALGMIDDRLHQLAFTRRGHVLRIISLRPASRRERARYNAWVDQNEQSDV